MIFLYPYLHQILAIAGAGLLLIVSGLVAYLIFMMIMEKIRGHWKRWIRRFVAVCVIIVGFLFVTGLGLTLLKIHQVNTQLGFRYATPDTLIGEHFIITKVETGKTMDRAGLKVHDRIQFASVDDLYALLVNNQGSEVKIPVLRNSKPMLITVSVPEMDLMGIKVWPFNMY